MMAADASMISPVQQTEQIAQKAPIPSTDLEITADDDAAHEAAVSKLQKSLKEVWTSDPIFVDPIKEDDLERLQRLSVLPYYYDGFCDTIIDVRSNMFSTTEMPIIMCAALCGSLKCFTFLEQLEANLLASIPFLHGIFTINLDCIALAVLSGCSDIWRELQGRGLPLFNNLGVWFTANLVRDCRMFAYLLENNKEPNKYDYINAAIRGLIVGKGSNSLKMLNILKEDPTWGPLWENAGPNDLPFDDLLCLAAEYDARVIGAELIFKKGASINKPNEYKNTPLHYAAKSDSPLGNVLVSKGAAVNAKGWGGETPLHCAAERGSTKIAELLLSKGANVDSYEDSNALSEVKGERMLRLLLSYGADPIDYWVPLGLIRTAEKLWIEKNGVNGKNKRGRTLLHRAARYGDEDDGEWLISQDADINAKDETGNTPLHQAAGGIFGKRIGELLISKGADINAKNNNGDTPLIYAVKQRDSTNIGELLISKGADINAKNNNGSTSLHYAAWYNREKIGGLLISKGTDINAKNNVGNTPLHYAAWNSSSKIGELLISKGADTSAKNNKGETPLDCTKKKRSVTSEDKKKMEQLLLPKGQ